MTDQRKSLLNDLVNEVSRDDFDKNKVQSLMDRLGIEFSDDPMQLLNNILKGIHSKGPQNEQKN